MRIYKAFLVLIVALVFFSCKTENTTNTSALAKVAIREAGNQLLLKNQDSTSLIRPVLELKTSVFKLEFNKPLAFEPSQLVKAIENSFNKTALAKSYRVEVLQCTDNEVAYSYEIHETQERTIIPCAGRALPEGCYSINISFLDNPKAAKSYTWLLYFFVITLLIVVLIMVFKKRKSETVSETVTKAIDTDFEKLGVFQFYPEQNKLVKAATTISLSKKECEILAIFVANPNQIIKRDELTKKVWEDNGVIVGRSLDTYISKLRKKLKEDTTIKLTNIHGVGYKLEIE
ncbi:winged helix-turn-helix domain-containing protein [uncultured Lacinutrix sp.]|uniref:winged helix-turn-helix domain-containing protein n=1 Tax=uncultured Lacinutrix sp. TaxID=574032 RepID=UPI00263687BF|nr:winged helix-turn-helix domain-containing protein [uncultured Lacinutrix sp.]